MAAWMKVKAKVDDEMREPHPLNGKSYRRASVEVAPGDDAAVPSGPRRVSFSDQLRERERQCVR